MESIEVAGKGKIPARRPGTLTKAKFGLLRTANNIKYGFGRATPMQLGVGVEMHNSFMTPKEKKVVALTELYTSLDGLKLLCGYVYHNLYGNKPKQIEE